MGRCQRDGKIGDTVTAGQQSGQNAGVGCIRNRAGRECLAEADAVPGQAIEGRRLDGFVAVAVDVVGAERIDCDQEDFWLLQRLCGHEGRAGSQPANQDPSRLHGVRLT